MARGGFRLDAGGRTLTVTVTTSSGGTPTCYTTSTGASTQSLPATISADTSFFFDGPEELTISVKTGGGAEIASSNGGTIPFSVRNGQFSELAPSVDRTEFGAVDGAAYVARAASATASGLHKNTPSSTYGDWFTFGNAADSNGGAKTGTPPEGWGPFVVYQKFGDTTGGSNAPIPHTTQAGYVIASYYGPTSDDAAEAFSANVLLKDTGGGGFIQTNKVTAFEADAQIDGANQVTGGNSYVLGQGSRIIMNSSSYSDIAYGVKVSAATTLSRTNGCTGTLGQWQGFRDDIYNPAGTVRDHSESVHGLNRITTEQSFLAFRSGYGAKVQMDLAGTGGGAPAVMLVQMPSPGAGGNTTTVADGAITSGSRLMTTATAPTPAWIGRGLANANIPAGTQVLNYYSNGDGTYTVVMNANATGTASSQSVTLAEIDLVGLRINQAAAGTTTARAIEYYATGASTVTAGLSRTGVWLGQGGFQVIDSSAATLINLNSTGLTFTDGKNITAGTSTGTKIGTGTTQKLGFWNATPVAQQARPTDAASIITLLTTLGLCA